MGTAISASRGDVNVRLSIFPQFGCNPTSFWVITLSEEGLAAELLINFFDDLEESNRPIFESVLRQKGFHCWVTTRKPIH
jgi:hypothetical protein